MRLQLTIPTVIEAGLNARSARGCSKLLGGKHLMTTRKWTKISTSRLSLADWSGCSFRRWLLASLKFVRKFPASSFNWKKRSKHQWMDRNTKACTFINLYLILYIASLQTAPRKSRKLNQKEKLLLHSNDYINLMTFLLFNHCFNMHVFLISQVLDNRINSITRINC